ncbi:MAG TPA: right-handed parallel beta-helix repeat-containing protein, partial [Tahibacter sp.]|nr:right-handed parallel beta-helix repeat-containing protein [Tahibacter sp.]
FSPDGDNDDKELLLRGGWNAQCTSRTLDPSTTVLRAVASTPNAFGKPFFFFGDNARYVFESIRYENFANWLVSDKPCIGWDSCPDTAAIVVRYNEFRNGETVRVDVYDAQQFQFRDNVVAKLDPITHDGGDAFEDAPVAISVYNDEDAPQVSFNTFADIDCNGTIGGVMLRSHSDAMALHHNIFNTSCQDDFHIVSDYGGVPVAPYRNLYLGAGGSIDGNLADQGNVMSFNPQFVDASGGDYRLQNGSPAVNAGASAIEATLEGFLVPAQDMKGQSRPTGSRFDIGAYESLVNDAAPPTITVTSASDAGAGTLRAAIAQANTQVGTAQRIVFNIPGNCPRTIALQSELPDVTDTLVIDGYSQPGASANTLERGSDANLCILLTAATGGVGHAFEVPAGQPAQTRLGVQGIAFASGFAQFSTAAVLLRSGSQHRIAGNAFGGTGPGSLGALGSLPRGVLLSDTAKEAQIGGPEPADRNTFGGMQQNAIVVTGAATGDHVIQNNYIGLRPDGLVAEPNQASGISISGGTDILILDNSITASDDGIFVSGASTQGVRIQRNRIGVNAIGIGVAAHANGDGIVFGGGTSQHVVGYATNDNIDVGRYSNDISNNRRAGIVLTTTAGASIAMRGNRVAANGRDGSGLGIDLGTYGQQANDPADADAGPNLGQNWPSIRDSLPNGATRQVKARLETNPNRTLRVDFYRAPDCSAATGANATTYVGSVNVDSGASGTVNIDATISALGGPGYLTATATHLPVGSTSEVAPCYREVDDRIFADRFE